MPGIDEVLERLVIDADFRRWLQEDPAAALRGYELSASDVELLSSQVDDSSADPRGLEQRISKSALFGLVSGILTPGVAQGGDASQAQPSQPADGWGDPQPADEVDPKPSSSLVLKGSKINQNLLSGLSDIQVEQEPQAPPPDGSSNATALGGASGSGGEPPEVAGTVASEPPHGDYQLEVATGEPESSPVPPGNLTAQVPADQNESGALEADAAQPAQVDAGALPPDAEAAEPTLEHAVEHHARTPGQGVRGQPEPFWRLAEANDVAGENGPPSDQTTPSGDDSSQQQVGPSRTTDITSDD